MGFTPEVNTHADLLRYRACGNDGEVALREPTPAVEPSPYISPKELAARWCCDRSSVAQNARRAGLTRLYLGTGRAGMVRFIRKEIEAFEISRRV